MTGKTITQKHTEQQVQANIHAAAAELPATAKLDQQLTNTGLCDDPTDNGSPGRVTASSTYQVHNLDPEQYPNLFGHLRDWWTQHTFRVLDDSHQTSTVRYLWVENNQDGFRMAMQSNDGVGLFLTPSSPCVWPNGHRQRHLDQFPGQGLGREGVVGEGLRGQPDLILHRPPLARHWA
jgi:hypothetical protein